MKEETTFKELVNNNRPFNKKRTGIISQIIKPLFWFLIILIFFEQAFLLAFFLSGHIKTKQVGAINLVNYTAEMLEGYKAIGWLTEYWLEHYDEMELIYDKTRLSVQIDKIEKEFTEMGTFKSVTYENINRQDPEIQKLYAEVCYARLISEFDSLKYSFMPKYLFAFVIDPEEEKGTFLITGAYPDEKRVSDGGDIYELGYEIPYERGMYPQLDVLLHFDDADQEYGIGDLWKFEFKNGDGSVHMFGPVYSPQGEMVMIVGASYDWFDFVSSGVDMSFILLLASSVVLILILRHTGKLLRKNVVDPVSKEQTVLDNYSQDKDPEKAINGLAEVVSNNEIEALAVNFSSMITELDRYMDEIRHMTEEKERIAAELSMAEKIQAGMLPSDFPAFPDHDEFELYAIMDPAKETGGDFYDFFLIDDDHIALVIADVSGKGMPAALFMMNAMTLIRTRTKMNMGDPGQILADVNNLLCERNDQNMFVTVWMAVLDLKTGKGVAVNAGHEDPVIRRGDGAYEIVIYDHSMVMGALKDMEYPDHEFELNPGDTIYVYTDGVPEAINEAEEFYGTNRLKEKLNEFADLSMTDLLPAIRKDIEDFACGAEQFDDITMLGFKYFRYKD
ncbi:MAG: serine/threonine-protein phosphatase [Lachnospiraceae bacterium]|nr:serine/threonine-protein phosphatase [Lachnospiraceae bacterium]